MTDVLTVLLLGVISVELGFLIHILMQPVEMDIQETNPLTDKFESKLGRIIQFEDAAYDMILEIKNRLKDISEYIATASRTNKNSKNKRG